MHGAGGGAPIGNKNSLKHGAFSAEAIEAARHARALVRIARETMEALEWPGLARRRGSSRGEEESDSGAAIPRSPGSSACAENFSPVCDFQEIKRANRDGGS